jgi:hypothetical protein
MQFTHLAGRKPIADYEADVMPHGGFSGGAGIAVLALIPITSSFCFWLM